jgi:RNA polymerase sigma-70 factor (ECF subfamily)
MDAATTTAAIQRFLGELADARGGTEVEPIIRDLLSRAAHRLHFLSVRMLRRSYPRLARPPLNLEVDELLSALVERLLKALRAARPNDVRHFFSLANQHIRWELNSLARRLDDASTVAPLADSAVAAPQRAPSTVASSSAASPNARRILHAIEELPDDEREVFSLVRIQEMAQTEVASMLGVSSKTVQRRLNRSLVLLTQKLGDLGPPAASAG